METYPFSIGALIGGPIGLLISWYLLTHKHKKSVKALLLILVLLTGCATSWHYRNQNTRPKAIIRAVDNHGQVIEWEFDYTLRSLKVITDLDLKYEHEYMVIAPHPEGL